MYLCTRRSSPKRALTGQGRRDTKLKSLEILKSFNKHLDSEIDLFKSLLLKLMAKI